MKKLFLLIVAISVSFAFTACKKCVTCKYEYDYLGQKKEVSFPQLCGNNKQIKEYKDNAEAEANRYGVSAECTTEK